MDKDAKVMIKIPYGLYILTARDGDTDNGCVINTVTQITASPISLMIAVNKNNYTEELIRKSGKFNVSILDTGTDFETIQHFGFQSGRQVKKIFSGIDRMENGVSYIEVEHFTSEISVTEIFKGIIEKAFPDVEILISEEENAVKTV